MADTTKKKGGKAATKGGGPKTGPLIAWVAAPIIGVVFFATILLLTVGMLPTIAAFVVDRYPRKLITKTVGFMNFAGCAPYVMQLWTGSQTVDQVADILGEPTHWLVMYGTAGVGWTIYFLMPPLAAAWLAVSQEMRQKALQGQQQQLIEEWGPEVRSAAGGGTDRPPETDAMLEAAAASAANAEGNAPPPAG
ncbi:MAG: hypothetical protein AB7G39_05020 [Alphaproteobacteria bacterium]